ncbi:dihydroorotate dehydrogenase (fumarate), partial [Lecanoromycetidae sp. Uapishka_2]
MPLNFNPPLINSSNPWATDEKDLQALYDCLYTGAVTTRTSTSNGFAHADEVHQYCFFSDDKHTVKQHSARTGPHEAELSPTGTVSSLNTLGYSPHSTPFYLYIISQILENSSHRKPIIISVTGNSSEILDHYRAIAGLQALFEVDFKWRPRLLMEINLSCPNIAGKPPPAYSKDALLEYLLELGKHSTDTLDAIEVGIKTPPYTYQTQFDSVISALLASSVDHRCPISFVTATNTLGNCLVLDSNATPALNSTNETGIGGLAGSSLHPLALGNVATLRRMLDAHEQLKDIEIIGVGGVSDAAGYSRMRSVGAAVVGVGTALGVEGVSIFEKILGKREEKG